MATSTIYTPIMNALLAQIRSKCGALFQTYTRRFVMFEDLAQSLQGGGTLIRQPYLCVLDGMITAESGIVTYQRTGRGVPSKRLINRAIVIYAQVQGGNIPAGTDWSTIAGGGDVFYPLIEAVEAALEPPGGDPYGVQTLGGAVSHCWLQGSQIMWTGDMDPNGQGMVIMPVHILIP